LIELVEPTAFLRSAPEAEAGQSSRRGQRVGLDHDRTGGSESALLQHVRVVHAGGKVAARKEDGAGRFPWRWVGHRPGEGAVLVHGTLDQGGLVGDDVDLDARIALPGCRSRLRVVRTCPPDPLTLTCANDSEPLPRRPRGRGRWVTQYPRDTPRPAPGARGPGKGQAGGRIPWIYPRFRGSGRWNPTVPCTGPVKPISRRPT